MYLDRSFACVAQPLSILCTVCRIYAQACTCKAQSAYILLGQENGDVSLVSFIPGFRARARES